MDKKQIEELRHLSPEERIKKLKELEEQKKKEIEQARKILKQSEVELDEKKQLKAKLPIEQLRADNTEMLLTLEDREMFMIKRFLSERDLKQVLRDKDLTELENMLAEDKIAAEEQQVSDWEQRQEEIKQEQAAATYEPQQPSDMYGPEPTDLQQQLEFYANEVQEMYKTAQDSAGMINQSTMDRFYQIKTKFERAATYSDLDEGTQTALKSLDQALSSVKYSQRLPGE